MYAEQTGIVVICLLDHLASVDQRHPAVEQCHHQGRVSNPLQYKTVSRGDDYLFAPFSITLPDDIEGQAPVCNFMIENISRDLIAIVRSVDLTQGAPTLTIELVTSATPDTVEIEYPTFEIRSVQYNANSLTFTAQIDAMVDIPYPAGAFDPSGFPALHGLA